VKNNANAAAALMAEVVRQEPKYANPQIIWADALEKLGDITGAIAHLKVAVQLQPQDAKVKMKLTRLLTSEGQTRDTTSVLSTNQSN
jgi:Tfp pilus assembly protein PilF